MAVISAGKGSRSAAGSIKYVAFEKNSTQFRAILTEGVDCSGYYKDAIDEFKQVRSAFGKEGGRQAHHMVLAFSSEEESRFTHEELFEKAVKIAKVTFPAHQVWLGMHTDTEHVHVHMIVNSINLETGLKMQIAGRKGMHEIMNKVQQECVQLGLDSNLTVGEKSQEQGRVSTNNVVEYKLIESAKSWKADIAAAVYESLQHAENKMEFVLGCSQRGVRCHWDDNRKNVTFSMIDTPSKKVRASNLAKTFTLEMLSSKESMEYVFNQNKARNRTMEMNDINDCKRGKSLEQTRERAIVRERSRGLER